MTQAKIEEIARCIWNGFSGEEELEFRAATFNAQIEIVKRRVPISMQYGNLVDITYAIGDLVE